MMGKGTSEVNRGAAVAHQRDFSLGTLLFVLLEDSVAARRSGPRSHESRVAWQVLPPIAKVAR